MRSTRAAGVSPPWFGKNALAGRFDLCSANNRTRSGGRQPAVVPKNAPATGSDFRALIALATHDGPVHHGGLTPPALVLRVRRTVTRAAFALDGTLRRTATAGLRQPLLVHGVGRDEEITIFAVATNAHSRSGGRQPAVGWQTRASACRQDDSICVRRTTARGAAGVSPPWYRKTHLQRGAISGN
jgi:hypothetical protein